MPHKFVTLYLADQQMVILAYSKRALVLFEELTPLFLHLASSINLGGSQGKNSHTSQPRKGRPRGVKFPIRDHTASGIWFYLPDTFPL